MRIVRAAAGGAHSLALSSTGGVFSFGSGSFGALGRGTTEGEGAGGSRGRDACGSAELAGAWPAAATLRMMYPVMKAASLPATPRMQLPLTPVCTSLPLPAPRRH